MNCMSFYDNGPDSHLAWAILVTIFCCLPFGIVAIVYAAQVDTKSGLGDYAGACESSEKARNWCIASMICGIIWGIFYGTGMR